MVDVRGLIGESFKGWRLAKELGRGADGIVYLAQKEDVDRAVKLFFPESLKKNGLEEQLERIELQLSLAGKKHHPNLVEVFDGGLCSDTGTIYLFMEFIPGSTLEILLGKLPQASVAPLIAQLADAACFLESQGLVHRDIKPANIIVNDDFTSLCLLDLGIVYESIATEGDDSRLSGGEFVASLRYSPPEFVWRQEASSDNSAWRAITFYQIGATIYEMLEGRCIFDGYDKPRACLYDSVRWRTPSFTSPSTEDWIVHLAQSCLVKDWRERVSLIDWSSFSGPSEAADFSQIRRSIRLRQIHADEKKVLEKEMNPIDPGITLRKALWEIQGRVFMEVRRFLIAEQIFPRFSGNHKSISEVEYLLQYVFEADESLNFKDVLEFNVLLCLPDTSQQSLEVSISALVNGESIFKGLWLEVFSVEKVFERCKLALYTVADKIVPVA